MLLVAWLATVVIATPATQDRSDKAAADEAFYYFGERRIRLEVSATEVVVGFESARRDDVEQAVRSLLPDASVSAGVSDSSRTYSVVTLRSPLAAGTPPASDATTGQLATVDAVEFVAPVYRDPMTGAKLLPTSEIIVKAAPGVTADALGQLLAAFGVTVDRRLRGSEDEFVLRADADANVVQRARLIHESGLVIWAEPNFIQDYRSAMRPNDPRLGQQWYLTNPDIGPGDAHVRAESAWDIEVGNPSIVIAVVDDGVEITHEDLAPNIYVNPNEIPANGFDDDQNGYIDDVNGWDFAGNDRIVSPSGNDENHGTAVAGIAAARGSNGLGVSGVCPRCTLLPVKIVNGSQFATTDRLAEALRYAAGIADVINNSWGGGAPSATLASALQYARAHGRNGRGTVVVSAAGNSAGGNVELFIPSTLLRAGTHRFRWTYSKDTNVDAGDDAAWLSTVSFSDGIVRLSNGGPLPQGWTTGGDAEWVGVFDEVHSDEGFCWGGSMRSGNIGPSQSSWIEVVRTVVGGTSVSSLQYVSSERGFDGLRLQIDLDNNGTFDVQSGLMSGVPPSGVAYPAAYPESIAVGASSDRNCRSHYSQFGPELAFLAPGSAGFNNLGMHTTDRSGSSGYGPLNYVDDFGGTSSASPVAAGIVGLMLSRNPTLSPAQVKQILQDTADKVGVGITYVNGRHPRYGSGRLNAARALTAVTPPTSVEPPAVWRQPSSQIVPFGTAARLSVDASGSALFFQWYAGVTGDVSAPVAGATAAVLDTPPVTAPAQYWVRVSNAAGSADSSSAALSVGAAFDSTLRVPRCHLFSGVCDSGWLLNGRGLLGPEPHQPNQLQICGDGTGERGVGRIDRIRVTPLTVQFTSLQMVRVEVDTATSIRPGRLELFLADTPSAPNWIRFATLEAPFIGSHTFVATYELPPSRLQAIRARLYQSSLPTENYGSCGAPDSYADTDDIVFPSNEALSMPRILIQPRGGVKDQSGVYPLAEVFVGAIGSAPLQYQWYRGVAGDTTSPITTGFLPNRPILSQMDQNLGTARYWVRVSNAFGAVDSETVTVTTTNSASASYSTLYKTPLCPLTFACSASTTGRGTVDFEVNQPNTLFATCPDGNGGRSTDESIESIGFDTPDRLPPGPGKTIRVRTSVNVFSGLHDRLDFYSAADASNPVWTHITTLRPASGQQFFVEFTLPYGAVQAVRVRLRYQGTEGPCGNDPGSYDDHDDLVFPTTASATMAPVIATPPRSAVVPAGQPHTLSVGAVGPSLVYQWYRGPSGSMDNPVALANSRTLTIAAASGTTEYWVRVSAPGGSVDSSTATIKGVAALTAAASQVLKAPACLSWSGWCDSGTVLTGRGGLGPEINAPNTIAATCVDGTSGRFHIDESVDAIRVSSMDGEPFTPGSTVKVDVSAWIFSQFYDVVDVFHAESATSPVWVHVASLTPQSGGAQTLSTGFVLPSGTLQAVRARLRYRGAVSPCGGGPYDDHDDLAFAVGGPATLSSPAITLTSSTTQVASSPSLSTAAPAIWPGLASPDALRLRVSAPVAETHAQIEHYRAAERIEMIGARDFAVVASPPILDSGVSIDAPASPSATSSDVETVTAPSANGEPPKYSDAASYTLRYHGAGITYTEAWFKTGDQAFSAIGSCIVYIERATNTALLVNDAGNDLVRGTLGREGSLSNRQCSVDLPSMRVAVTGDGFVVTMVVRLSRDYAVSGVYRQTVDATGMSSGWSVNPIATTTTMTPTPAPAPGGPEAH